MKRSLRRWIWLLGLCLCAAFCSAETNTENGPWLFTYFVGNGEDGLHLAASADGYHWEALNEGKPVLAPRVGTAKLMRDPYVLRAPDGVYHLVWTSGWHENNIGHASTRDCITWSEEQEIPVMKDQPGVQNTWAPETIWDAKRGEFLIFWASSIAGKFSAKASEPKPVLDHRIYASTTKDWRTFSPARLFYDPGFSVIDATMVSDGDQFHLIVKDETESPPKKHLLTASSDDVEGPWAGLSEPFTRDWVEGPTAIKVNGQWVVYYDCYREKHYGAVRSADWKTWEDVTDKISLPQGVRHGTMIPVPAELLAALRGQASNARPAAKPLDPKLPTLFVAGDSTAAHGGADLTGWGVPFAELLDSAKINYVNLARGGRSSRTFITEGLWDNLISQVKPGDTVLIQFGHNDAGPVNDDKRARGSLPGLGDETQEIDNLLTHKHEVVHTYGWYMRRMIDDVKAKKATPIVLSLTVRNIWKDGVVERINGGFRNWSRELAHAENVSFVDVTRILADDYQALGPAKVAEFFPKDHTHTNMAGAEYSAAAILGGLKGLRPPPLDAVLSEKGRSVAADTIGWLNLPEPRDPKLPSLLLIGDSTVRNGRGDGAGGQWGWGDELSGKYDPAKMNAVNRAVGGLSSRTFLTQGHWTRALTLLKAGDVVVMQFGHNDAGPLNDTSRARGTIRGVGDEAEEIDNLLTHAHEQVHSYGWYLRRYIRDAKERGAFPVVCSPIPRKRWKDGKIERADKDYGGWAKAVAERENVPFIDLNNLIAERYEKLGEAAVEPLFADEHTHTSKAGAELNADVVWTALQQIDGLPAWIRQANAQKK
ncbi:MAG TPA: GDSL-type esterase/lipase family protein [Opitutaceae bacterium]|nr:GDSL-type esterase/lipase family protein [Opitutaceae bacterium]